MRQASEPSPIELGRGATAVRAATCLLLLGLVLTPALPAQAGGLWLPLRGVIAAGRANAVTAGARDPNALTINPANLALIDGHVLLVDAAYLDMWLTFDRADGTARNGEAISFEPVENIAPGIVTPSLLFTTDLGTDEWGLGVGVYTPWGARARYPTDGAQRYSVVDLTASIMVYQSVGLAWRPHPRVAVGASFQNLISILDGVGVASTYVGLWGEPEDTDLDSLVHVRAVDYFTPSGSVGVWAEPLDGFEIGASFQVSAAVEDTAAVFETQLPAHYVFDETAIEGNTMGLALDLPMVARVGLRYVHDELFDLELDASWESWSLQQKVRTWPNNVRIVNVPTVGSIQADNLNLERGMRDTFSVAVGGDWHVLPERLSLRAGFGFESGASPPEYYSVFQHDADKLFPTVGASVRLANWTLDAAYSYVAQLPQAIRNSQAKQVNSAYPEGATLIGNGDYASGYHVAGIGFTVAF